MRAALCLLIAAHTAAANWVSVKTGPFLVISDSNPKETRERAAELEQFRFSLGELLGRHDLTVHPQLQLFVVANPASVSGTVSTRTGAVALVQASGPLTLTTRQELARILLSRNVDRLPPHLEHGLETFLSTTEVRGAKVTWGSPPPPDQRDADWALVHWLITNPETYGNVRVLLANLENRVDEDVAFRNSIHKPLAQVRLEVAAYVQGARFPTIDAPSRPLSPDRDLPTHTLDPNEVTLRLADLLDSQSEQRYRTLLNANAYRVEAEEGLALLAAQHNDSAAASELLQKALADGSKNAAAIIAYARAEPDADKARTALERAVATDPGSAEAHFLLGAKLTEPAKRIEQYTLATKLDPRKQPYWVSLAQTLEAHKQWQPAAKAWRGAEQAAVTPEERETFVSARLAIEGERIDFEDAEKRRAKEAEQRELNRLKQQAIAEIRAAEAKVNTTLSPEESASAIPWEQLDDSAGRHADGQLVRIDCAGKSRHLVIRTGDGKLLRLNADPAKLTGLPACGPLKARAVAVTYTPAGQAVSIDFR